MSEKGDIVSNAIKRRTDGTEIIDRWAFSGRSDLTSITIPDGVKGIGEFAFSRCSGLTNITIPEGVTSIGSGTFMDCTGLKEVILPNSLRVIRDSAFKGCSSLMNITIPEGITILESGTFEGCTGLKEVILPDSLKEIRSSAFKGCSSLMNINIPEGVEKIGGEAFEGCYNLIAEIPKQTKDIGERAFQGVADIIIRDGEICSTYGAKAVNGYVEEGLVFRDDSKTMLLACQGNTERALLPKSLERIGASAFSGCFVLEEVDIPDSVTEMDGWNFNGCRNLKKVKLPANIRSIGFRAFSDCSSLTEVRIPERVTRIDAWAFSGCSSLESVFIPDSVTAIGTGAFRDCSEMIEITIPENVGMTHLTDYPVHLKALHLAGWENLAKIIIGNGEDNRKIIKDITINGQYIRDIESILITPSFAQSDTIPIVLRHFNKIKIEFQEECYTSGTKFSLEYIPLINPSEKELACLLIYQDLKSWQSFIKNKITAENANEVFTHCASIISSLKKLSTKPAGRVAEAALNHNRTIKPEVLYSLSEALEAKKQGNEELKAITQKNALPINQEEKEAFDKLERLSYGYDLQSAAFEKAQTLIDRGFHYKGSQERCSEKLVRVLIAEYIKLWESQSSTERGAMSTTEVLRYVRSDCWSELSETIVDGLEKEELVEFFKEKVTGKDYRYFVLPFARYADDKDITWFISVINEAKKGRAKERYRADSSRTALIVSDTKTAMAYFDKTKDLGAYARYRKMSVDALKDKLLYSFDFDENDQKEYDLGKKKIILKLNDDLSLSMYESETGKEVKSIPKRDSDPDKYEAAKADFSEKKATVKKIVRNVSGDLFQNFLSGKNYKAEEWKSRFFINPVLKKISRLIVWTQDTSTFTVTDQGMVDAAGLSYELTDQPVKVAHPMEMEKDDIDSWQRYFARKGLKQAFDQVWEPVIDFKKVRPDRYSSCEIPLFRFNGQEKHGVRLEMSSEYNHRSGGYEYEDIEIFLSGCDIKWQLTTGQISDATMQSTITIREFTCKRHTRQTNHIIVYLDKCTVYGRIAKDDETVLENLDGYTAAQIDAFLKFAVENSSVKCTAAFLDYKNEHFADFASIDEFTLELI